jgi:hypothetical protein
VLLHHVEVEADGVVQVEAGEQVGQEVERDYGDDVPLELAEDEQLPGLQQDHIENFTRAPAEFGFFAAAESERRTCGGGRQQG